MSELEIVVNEMHMKGHTDKWCRDTCDPIKFPDLNSVHFVHRVDVLRMEYSN